jgi:hypothetical protein
MSETLPEGIQAATGEDRFAEDSDFVRIFKRGIGGVWDMNTAETRAKLHRSWQLIVQAYSQRSLTKETDKLAALLGIIDEMSRCTSDRLVSGVWEKFLPMDLLWCVYGPGCPTIGSLIGYSGRLGPPGVRLKEFRGELFFYSSNLDCDYELSTPDSIILVESLLTNHSSILVMAQCQGKYSLY